MAQITIRKIPDEVHRALARNLLRRGLFPSDRVPPGDVLRSLWKDADLGSLSFERDRSPIDPAVLE